MRPHRDRFAVVLLTALLAALGTATPLVAGVDEDGDGYSEAVDCNDQSDQVWAIPTEALQLRFSNKVTLVWSTAADLGGTPSSARFDTLRSTSASNFAAAPPSSCADPQGLTTSSTDTSNPAVGTTFCYLVRVTNACGAGTAGNRSNGTPRAALTCDCSALCSDGVACTLDFCVDGTCSHAPIPPTIEAQPQAVAVCAGDDAHFSIRAAGQGTLHYQWKQAGANVGSDSPSLTLAGLPVVADGNAVTCVVTDTCASSTSAAVPVTVFGSSASCSGGGSGQEAPGGASVAVPDYGWFFWREGLASNRTSSGAAPSRQPTTVHAGDVYLFSGEYYREETDLVIEGRGFDFEWTRKYRSRQDRLTGLGHNWDFSYNRFVTADLPGTDMIVADGNSRRDHYQLGLTGCWTSPGFFRELCPQIDGTLVLTFPNKTTWKFAALDGNPAQGKIVEIRDSNGNAMTFAYTAGRLDNVTDTLNRTITVAYNADGYISSLTDFFGRQVLYAYYGPLDASGMPGDLKSVRSPVVTGTPNGNDFSGGKTTTFQYAVYQGQEQLNHNLLTVTDPSGQVILRNTYTTAQSPADPRFDRIDRQTFSNGSIGYVYVAQVPSPGSDAVTMTVVNDRAGNVGEVFYNDLNQAVMLREYTGRAPNPVLPTGDFSNRSVGPLHPSDPTYFETRFEYTPAGLITGIVRQDLNRIDNVYDSGNTDVRLRGNLLQRVWSPGPLGGDQPSITESWTYGTTFGDEPCVCRGCCGEGGDGAARSLAKQEAMQNLTEAKPLRRVKVWFPWDRNMETRATSYQNGRGHTYTRVLDPVTGNTLEVTAPTVTTGVLGGGTQTITESWQYNSFGQLTVNINPREVRDELTYYTSGPQTGYLKDVTIDAPGPLPGSHLALTTTYQHDAVGNVTAVTDPKGNTETFVYNQLDQVVRHVAKPPFLYQTDFCYNANDSLVRTDVQNVDETGALEANAATSTIFMYDNLQTLKRMIIDPDTVDVHTAYEYDPNGNRTLVRSGEATNGHQPTNVVRTFFDERGLRYRLIDAEGDAAQATVQWDFDGNGNVTTIREGLEATPRVTVIAHDGYDRAVSLTDPEGNVVTTHYDANGSVASTQHYGELTEGESGTNVLLQERFVTYDEIGRPVQSYEAFFDPETGAPVGDGSSTTRTFYDEASQAIRMEDDNGHGSDTAYDGAGRVTLTLDAEGNTSAYGYDPNGNVLTETETEVSDLATPPEVYVTTHTVDSLDRVTSSTSNAGQVHVFLWDSRDNRTVQIDAKGNESRSEFDALGRQVATHRKMTTTGDGGGPVSGSLDHFRTFDDNSRVSQETDDSGNITAYQFDARNRLTATIRADGTSELASYDVHNNLVSLVDANGTEVTATFDLDNRLTTRSIARAAGVLGTTFEAWKYDGLARVVYAQNDTALVTRKYDSMANVTQETLKIGSGPTRTLSASFDDVGNRSSRDFPAGYNLLAAFDGLNRVKTITSTGPGTCSGGAHAGEFCTGDADCLPSGSCTILAPRVTAFDYAGPGRVVRRTNSNGTESNHTFDTARRMTGTTTARLTPYTLIDNRSYTWDAMDNKTSRTDSRLPGSDRVHDYAYDSTYRMIHSVETPPGLPPVTVDYTLDGMGNRVFVAGGADPGAYTMNDDLPEPADRQVNQSTSTPFDVVRGYDRNGNLLERSGTGETLSYDYRNQMVQSSGPLGTVTYNYDPFGRRVETDGRQYFYDGEEAVEERTAAGDVSAVYIYGGYGMAGREVVMALGDVTGDGLPDLWVPHSDDLGNVVAVSNASGDLLESYDYRDLGQPQFFNAAGASLPQSAIGNPILFKGLRFDEQTGLYLDSDGYLDPRAGSFTTRTGGEKLYGAMLAGLSQLALNDRSYAGGNPWSSGEGGGSMGGSGDSRVMMNYRRLRKRAFNSSAESAGRSGSGGDPGALIAIPNFIRLRKKVYNVLVESTRSPGDPVSDGGGATDARWPGKRIHNALAVVKTGPMAKLCPGHISCPTEGGSSLVSVNPAVGNNPSVVDLISLCNDGDSWTKPMTCCWFDGTGKSLGCCSWFWFGKTCNGEAGMIANTLD